MTLAACHDAYLNMTAKLSRCDLLQSLFNTAIAYLEFIGDDPRKQKVERERWRYIEICISSEPSELGLFKVDTDQQQEMVEEKNAFSFLDSDPVIANTI